MSEHEDTLAMLARCGQHQVGEPHYEPVGVVEFLGERVAYFGNYFAQPATVTAPSAEHPRLTSEYIRRVFDAFKGVR